jgi:thiosulfate/3-mercaptopyruvate sulfurtransferase
MTRDRHITVSRQAHLIKDVTQVAQASKLGTHQILDARGPARFRGDAPEPRAGLRAGHIPGSINVPYTSLLSEDGTMLPVASLRLAFEDAGVDLKKPIITSCGSGVTAAIINLALARLGHDANALYDGSWAEWGMYPDLKIATGA